MKRLIMENIFLINMYAMWVFICLFYVLDFPDKNCLNCCFLPFPLQFQTQSGGKNIRMFQVGEVLKNPGTSDQEVKIS